MATETNTQQHVVKIVQEIRAELSYITGSVAEGLRDGWTEEEQKNYKESVERIQSRVNYLNDLQGHFSQE